MMMRVKEFIMILNNEKEELRTESGGRLLVGLVCNHGILVNLKYIIKY